MKNLNKANGMTLNNAVSIKLLSLIFIIMLLQSCSKDPRNGCFTPKDNYIYLTAAQLNQTPYFSNPAFDTISYTSDKGDTLTFVKTKTDTTWYNLAGQGNPDCGYDQDFYQTIHNTYATIKGNGSFDVKHILREGTISSWNKIEYKFNNIAFWAYDDWINWSGFTTFRENNFLNNYNYKNSITIYINPSDTSVSNSCNINRDFGIYFISNKTNNLNWLIINPN